MAKLSRRLELGRLAGRTPDENTPRGVWRFLPTRRPAAICLGIAIAAAIVGVAKVAPADDLELARAVAQSFLDGGMKQFSIGAANKDGVVTLHGQVSSEEQRLLAIRLAKECKGVKQVVDDLSITTANQSSDSTKRQRSEAAPKTKLTNESQWEVIPGFRFHDPFGNVKVTTYEVGSPNADQKESTVEFGGVDADPNSPRAVLKRIAPKDCLAYFSYAGFGNEATGKPGERAASKNRTEQLWADEEVQAFVKRIAGSVGGWTATLNANEKATLDLSKLLMRRPMTAFISGIEEKHIPPAPRAPDPDVAAPAMPMTTISIDANGVQRIGVDFTIPPASPTTTPPATTYYADPSFGSPAANVPPATVPPANVAPIPATDVKKPAATEQQPTAPSSNAKPAELPPLPLPPGPPVAAPAFVAAVPAITAPAVGVPVVLPHGAAIPANLPPGAVVALAPPPMPLGEQTAMIFHGGAVVHLGSETARFRELLDKILKDNAVLPLPKAMIVGVEFTQVDPSFPDGVFAVEGEYLIVTDRDSAPAIVKAIHGGETPAWLTEEEKTLSVERPIARLRIDVVAAAKLLDETIDDEEVMTIVKTLGLDGISSFSCVFGLDGEGTVVKTRLGVSDSEAAKRLLAMLGNTPLTAADLKCVPADSTFAVAGKLDVAAVARAIAPLVVEELGLDNNKETPQNGPVPPANKPAETKSPLERVAAEVASYVFVDIVNDVIDPLGDTWCIWSSPSEGGLMATTLAWQVRDEAKLQTALGRLAVAAKISGLDLKQFRYRGTEVFYVTGGEEGGMGAWCVHDGQLVVGILPQTIKTYLARDVMVAPTGLDAAVRKTLADVPQVAQRLAQVNPGGEAGDGPLMLGYTDTRAALRFLYQYSSLALPTIAEACKQGEVNLPLHEIPSMAVVERYFAPSVSTLSRTEHGLVIEGRQTVPFMSGGIALMALGSSMGESFDLGEVVSAFGDSTPFISIGTSCVPQAMPVNGMPAGAYPVGPSAVPYYVQPNGSVCQGNCPPPLVAALPSYSTASAAPAPMPTLNPAAAAQINAPYVIPNGTHIVLPSPLPPASAASQTPAPMVAPPGWHLESGPVYVPNGSPVLPAPAAKPVKAGSDAPKAAPVAPGAAVKATWEAAPVKRQPAKPDEVKKAPATVPQASLSIGARH